MELTFGAAETGDGVAADAAAPARPATLAERIQADMNARRKQAKRVLSHPGAPSWRVEFRLPRERKELAPLEEASAKAVKRGEPATYDAALLATYATRVWFMGELVEDDGAPLTFRDKGFRVLLGLPESARASDVVRAVYDADGVVESLAWRLLDEASFRTEDEVEVEDPTTAG